MSSKLIMLPVQMQNGETWSHEVHQKQSGEIRYCVVMVSGIPRGAENDKSLDPRSRSPLWLDGEGIATFRSSPAGLGSSEGDTFRSTLRDRINLNIEIAKIAHKEFPEAKIIFAGASMGAHVAVRAAHLLIEEVPVQSLVLGSPCFYSDQAEVAYYGPNFKKAAVLSTNTNPITEFEVVKNLQDFKGRVFMFYQEFDSDMSRGGVLDLEEVINVVNMVMEFRLKRGSNDEYFTVRGGVHGFKSGGEEPDLKNIHIHEGSRTKLEVSQKALKFLRSIE